MVSCCCRLLCLLIFLLSSHGRFSVLLRIRKSIFKSSISYSTSKAKAITRIIFYWNVSHPFLLSAPWVDFGRLHSFRVLCWTGFLHKVLQVNSFRTLELEHLFVSFVVLWSCNSIFDSVPCKVCLLLFHSFLHLMHDTVSQLESA